MVAAGIILYGLAFVLFVRHAGNTKLFGLDQAGLGLACCALLWFLQVLVPQVS
jgi:hypothetical protein